MDQDATIYKCNDPACQDKPGFLYVGSLSRHVREVHGTDMTRPQHFCPYPECNRSAEPGFMSHENLRDHFRYQHSGDGLFAPKVLRNTAPTVSLPLMKEPSTASPEQSPFDALGRPKNLPCLTCDHVDYGNCTCGTWCSLRERCINSTHNRISSTTKINTLDCDRPASPASSAGSHGSGISHPPGKRRSPTTLNDDDWSRFLDGLRKATRRESLERDSASQKSDNISSWSDLFSGPTNSETVSYLCKRIDPSTDKPCNTVFSRPYDLTRHEDTVHNARKQKIICHLCTTERTFSRHDAFTRHMRVVHPDVDWANKPKRKFASDQETGSESDNSRSRKTKIHPDTSNTLVKIRAAEHANTEDLSDSALDLATAKSTATKIDRSASDVIGWGVPLSTALAPTLSDAHRIPQAYIEVPKPHYDGDFPPFPYD